MLNYVKNIINLRNLIQIIDIKQIVLPDKIFKEFTGELSWLDWIQPILNSDTDYGIVSGTNIWQWGSVTASAWKALDGKITTDDMAGFVGTSSPEWKWQLPRDIKISNLKLIKDANHLVNHSLYIELIKENNVIYKSDTLNWPATPNLDIIIDDIICDVILIKWTYSGDLSRGRCYLQELQVTAQIQE